MKGEHSVVHTHVRSSLATGLLGPSKSSYRLQMHIRTPTSAFWANSWHEDSQLWEDTTGHGYNMSIYRGGVSQRVVDPCWFLESHRPVVF